MGISGFGNTLSSIFGKAAPADVCGRLDEKVWYGDI
jgi:hypothetical protein